MSELGKSVPGYTAAQNTDSGDGWDDEPPPERPVEHDSVVGIIARNCLPISKRVSGSGRMQLYHFDVAPQPYQSSFAADVLGNDAGWVRGPIDTPVQFGGDAFLRD